MIKNPKNKKGAVATTMTWVVATIVILFVIFLFLIISGVLGIGRIGKKEVVPLRIPEQQQTLFAIAKNYNSVEGNLVSILNNLGRHVCNDPLFKWNMDVYENNKVTKTIKAENEGGGFYAGFLNIIVKDNPITKLELYYNYVNPGCYDEFEDE